MRRNRFSARGKTRNNDLLTMETLESRVLLAADLQGSIYQPADITNPFADQAVTIEQMVARAATTPYVAGDLMVALQVPYAAHSVQTEFYLNSLSWSELTGVPTNHMQTLMTVEQGADQSFVLVHLEIGQADLFETMASMDSLSHVLWTSPNFYLEGDQQDFVPNDPDYGQQYTHPLVGSESAWDVTLGESSIVIGITDDGVDLTHQDLSPNIWVNSGEIAGNGIDDDNNGYIDDVNGWDWANDTNDPSPDGGAHGTHVAGISAARTDNAIGVAGLSGHSTILPLQFYGGTNGWTASIINNTFTYAADNGAHIVNTSYNINGWVGDPVFTAGMQYMYDNGVLHFNSAGNGSELNPARQAFEQTFLVVSTDSADVKSGFSNWGTGVDISAPGSSVYSTLPGNAYGNNSGTSMAAPNAAGAAALIWSANPGWTRDQVAAQLLGTADNIDAQNPAYAGLLGSGRINVDRGLSETLAAPQVKALTQLPEDGGSTSDLTIDQFGISFNQVMDPASINNIAHYELRSAGSDGIFGNADDTIRNISMNGVYQLSTNQLNFNIDDGPLSFGEYQLTIVSGGVANPFGTALDGDGNGVGGDSFVTRFSIETSPPDPILPLGSLIYEQSFPGNIQSAQAVEQVSLDLAGGQSLLVMVNGSGGLVPEITVFDPAMQPMENVVGSGNVALTSVLNLPAAGAYTIQVEGNGGSTGSYEVSWLLNSGHELESLTGISNDTLGTAQAIDNTSVVPGSLSADRLAVIGSLPFSEGTPVVQDGFESGTLGAAWTSSSTNTGRIQVTGQHGTASGNFALLMDSDTDSSYSNNQAIWTVDLTGINSPTLVFDHADFSDEEDALPQSFTGDVNGDGVSISDDGVNWYRVFNPTTAAAGVWERNVIDLVDAANNAGMTLGAGFQIKFQQYDNFTLTTDGRGYDNISINQPDVLPDWYSFGLNDGQLATVAVTGYSGNGPVQVDLFDESGSLLQSGVAGDNVSSFISQFADATNDGGATTYYLQVSGTNADYSLLVLRDAEFDLEPNGTGSPQNIDLVQGALGHITSGAAAVAEPDQFGDGAVLDNAFAGVTLSNPLGGTTVNAASASFGAPTGTLVFSPGPASPSGWSDGADELRADFDLPTNFVSIDVGSDDASDVGFLRAYNAAGTLLEEVFSGNVSTGNSETISISRASSDIAYIIASGLGGDITPLDNLVFGAGTTQDTWEVSGAAGEEIRFDAFLPGEGEAWFDNGLDGTGGSDLRMELFDSSGSGTPVATGINSISYTPAQADTFQLVITSDGGAGEYYVQRQPTLDLIDPLGTKFLDGLAAAGSLLDARFSDDLYYQLEPSPTTNPNKQIIDLILVAEYTGGTVNNLEFVLESAMNGGPQGDVVQTIELWNDADGIWELVDTRAVATTDTSVTVSATGDLSRFVNPLHGEIIAKVKWVSPVFTGAPFDWTIDVDQFGWMIS